MLDSRGKSHFSWHYLQSSFTIWPQLTSPPFSLSTNLALSHSPLLARPWTCQWLWQLLAFFQCYFLGLNVFQHSFIKHQLSFCYRLNCVCGRGCCWSVKDENMALPSRVWYLLLLLCLSLASKPQFKCCLVSKSFLNCFHPPFPGASLLSHPTVLPEHYIKLVVYDLVVSFFLDAQCCCFFFLN